MQTLQPRAGKSRYAQFHIRLFGNFEFAADIDPTPSINQPRLRLILAYLILHCKTAHPRSRLAYLFWPDTNEKQAYTNLRNLLFLLRQTLPDADQYVDITAKTVQWRCNAVFSVDVIDFEMAIAQANLAEKQGNRMEEQRWLEQAAGCYQGELLPDFYDDWVLTERERLGQQFAHVLIRLVQIAEDLRQYDSAIAHANRLLHHDPLRETTHRLLMRLHALMGNRAGALRVYHACSALLDQELGVEPSAETHQIYGRLLADQPPVDGLANVAFAEEVTSLSDLTAGCRIDDDPAPVVGRHDEWRALSAAWRQAQQGKPQILLVTGEAGIGKTKIANELVNSAARQGFAVAQACAYPGEETLAFGAVIQWLRSSSITAALENVDDIWLIEAARLMPELALQRPDLPSPEPLREDWQRRRLYEALARIVLAADEPILLHIDNMHWCDPETLSWLHFLFHFDGSARLMLLGALRSEEVDNTHPVTRWRMALEQNGRHREHYQEITLGRLDAGETAKLTARTRGCELTTDELKWFYAETEGHPLFIVEMAQYDRTPSRAGLALDVPPSAMSGSDEAYGAAAQLPARVQAIVAARIRQLSPLAEKVAGAAAVLGREFSYAVLAEMTEIGEEQLISGLEELWHRHIIHEHGKESYLFSHDKLRCFVYTNLSRERRRLLHRRAAAVLQQVYAGELHVVGDQIAGHIQQSGQSQGKKSTHSLHRNDSTTSATPPRSTVSHRFGMPGILGLQLKRYHAQIS